MRRVAIVLVSISLATTFALGCRVLQFNIANGNPGAQNHGQDDVIAILNGSARPSVITLQEVCWTRFVEINTVAQARGYVGSMMGNDPSACGREEPYGNAIFVHGTLLNSERALHYFRNQEPSRCPEPDNRARPDQECKGIICVGFAPAGSGRAIACSTHLEPPHKVTGSRAVARAQATEALDFATFIWVATGRPLAVVGGDFNLESTEWAIAQWKASDFRMINDERTSTHDAGDGAADPRPIDYVFATNTIAPYTSWIERTLNSDHHKLFAQIWE